MSRPVPLNKLAIDWKAVGVRLRELRGFTLKQADVSKAVGVGQSHISAIEQGKTEVGAVVLYRFAKFYGKTIEWLLTGEDSDTK